MIVFTFGLIFLSKKFREKQRRDFGTAEREIEGAGVYESVDLPEIEKRDNLGWVWGHKLRSLFVKSGQVNSSGYVRTHDTGPENRE